MFGYSKTSKVRASQPDPAIVNPPSGKFTEEEMRTWPQFSGVRRVDINGLEYEDQHMLIRALHEADARKHFTQHGFKYEGRLAFSVPFASAPIWWVWVSLAIGRLYYRR